MKNLILPTIKRADLDAEALEMQRRRDLRDFLFLNLTIIVVVFAMILPLR